VTTTSRRRPPSRNAIEDALMRARSHLTARDWLILGLLEEHRVLTAPQVCDLTFNDPTTARHRLAVLYRLKVVNRFRPPPEDLGGGSAPYHYVLDRYGALLVAQQQAAETDDRLDDDSIYKQLGQANLDRRMARLNPDYLLAIATSQRLRHQVAVNGLFWSLARAARASGGRMELRLWQGEKAARRTGADQRVCVRPDGYGVWADDGRQLPFFLELDRGTEPLHPWPRSWTATPKPNSSNSRPCGSWSHYPASSVSTVPARPWRPTSRTCRWPPPTAASPRPAARTRPCGGRCAARRPRVDGGCD
jgi:protein involved in plasmid replication-relaxation